jgi:uncharacterized protein
MQNHQPQTNTIARKIGWLITSLLLAITVSSAVMAQSVIKDCAIKLPNVQFTHCVNGAEKMTTINNATFTLKSGAKTDYFNDPDGKTVANSAPILLAKIDNAKPFTLTAKLSPEFIETYDAGALYVYSSEKQWQKFAFEQDERGTTRVVSVRTIDTSDDNNHQPIGDKSLYLKISSDTHTMAFYFSTDKIQWNLARLYHNNYPSELWVGVSSQSPLGDGNATQFEQVSLVLESVKDFRMGM